MAIGIIVLAAGSSSRLGQSKQLVLIDGKPLLEKSVQAAMDSGADYVVVVLGDLAAVHQKTIEKLPVRIVVNNDWEKGMGNSMKAGLKNILQNYPEAEAAIVMVCDQPFLTSEHLKRLINKFHSGATEIVTSLYNQIQGVPALFSQAVFPQLLAAEDEVGARKIIQHYKGMVATVLFERGEIDIDTPEDLENLRTNH